MKTLESWQIESWQIHMHEHLVCAPCLNINDTCIICPCLREMSLYLILHCGTCPHDPHESRKHGICTPWKEIGKDEPGRVESSWVRMENENR